MPKAHNSTPAAPISRLRLHSCSSSSTGYLSQHSAHWSATHHSILEEACERATAALARARSLCILMGTLDMKGLLGAATIIKSLMQGQVIGSRVKPTSICTTTRLSKRGITPDYSTPCTTLMLVERAFPIDWRGLFFVFLVYFYFLTFKITGR